MRRVLVGSGCLLLALLLGVAEAQVTCDAGVRDVSDPAQQRVTFFCSGNIQRGQSATVTPSWSRFLTANTRWARTNLTINSVTPASQGVTRVKVAGTFQTAQGQNIKTCQTRRQLSLPGVGAGDAAAATASVQYDSYEPEKPKDSFKGVVVLFNPKKALPPAPPAPVVYMPPKYEKEYDDKYEKYDDKDEKYDDEDEKYDDKRDEKYDDKYDEKYEKDDDEKYGKTDDKYEKDEESYSKIDKKYGKTDDKYEKDEQSYGKSDKKYGKTDDKYEKDEESYSKTDKKYGKTDDKYEKDEESNGKSDKKYGKTDDKYEKDESKYGKTDKKYGKTDDKYEKDEDKYGKTDKKYGKTDKKDKYKSAKKDDKKYKSDSEEYDSYEDEYDINEEDAEYYNVQFDDWEEGATEQDEEDATIFGWGNDVRQCTTRRVPSVSVGNSQASIASISPQQRGPQTPAQLRLVIKCKQPPSGQTTCSIRQRLIVGFTGGLANVL